MDLRHTFSRELVGLGLPSVSGPLAPVGGDELETLPEPARRYLRFMGVAGKPRDWSLLVHARGRFRSTADGGWRACDAWWYDSSVVVARVFVMRIRVAGVVPIVARDTYRAGHGRMVGKLFDQITVVDGQGEEFDCGELVTYLNDLVLLAPSMLLTQSVQWRAAGKNSFELSLSDLSHTVEASVEIDERGAPRNFETTDRYYADPLDPKRLLRTPWSTPIAAMQAFEGRMLPTRARAVWHFPDRELPYAEFDFDPLQIWHNVAPSALERGFDRGRRIVGFTDTSADP